LDIVLHCYKSFFRIGPKRIAIVAPAELSKTPAATLTELPKIWTSGERLDVDAIKLAEWVRHVLGKNIFETLSRRVLQNEVLSRVLISADMSLLRFALAAPWELLEHSPVERPSGEKLAVVRILNPENPVSEPQSVTKIKLLALWADPDGDIDGMRKHVDELKNFVAANEEKLEAKILCFENATNVLAKCAGFSPNIVYYIGHGYQPTARKICLHVGSQGKPEGLDIANFVQLIEQVGSPRLVILNACESFSGAGLNPFLGAALQCVPRFDALIGMQTKVPVVAATRFAVRLLDALSRGEGLAKSMKEARAAMVAGTEMLPVVTRYIPVLIQNTSQDRPWIIDLDTQQVTRLRKLLAMPLEKIQHRLDRDLDKVISWTLTTQTGGSPISILTGPQQIGKSTSVRAVINDLLTVERIRNGERYLYFSTKGLVFAREVKAQVRQVLSTFASTFGALTHELGRALAEERSATPDDPLVILATWLQKKLASGWRFTIVLDDLPSELATELATANRVVSAGHLMLVTRKHELTKESAVARLDLGPVTESEISRVAPTRSTEEIQRILDKTNGIPYLVTMLLWSDSAGDGIGPLADRLALLSPDALNALRFVSAAELPLPVAAMVETGFSQEGIESLVQMLLLTPTADGAITVPEAVRASAMDGIDRAFEFSARDALFNIFEKLAFEQKTQGFRYGEVIRFYTEGFRQAIKQATIAEHPDEISILTVAKDVALELDYQLLEEGDEPETAKAIWEGYLSAAATAGIPEERETNVRYSRCLARLGEIEEAEEILKLVTDRAPRDDLQVRALLQRADILKDLGYTDSHTNRISVLQEALNIAEELRTTAGPNTRVIDEHIANIEHSIGNALGYGANAELDNAITHVTRAIGIFDRIRDLRVYRARAEIIEIRRYNGCLAEDQRLSAIETISRDVEELIARSMQYDAILHLYELGRLETTQERKAIWFRLAFERADSAYAPVCWHAGIQWKIAEVRAGTCPFSLAATDITRYCEELVRWRERAWSRRLRRDGLRFLAERYGSEGDGARQQQFLVACWDVIRDIYERGEGREDREVRHVIAQEISKGESTRSSRIITDSLLEQTIAENQRGAL